MTPKKESNRSRFTWVKEAGIQESHSIIEELKSEFNLSYLEASQLLLNHLNLMALTAAASRDDTSKDSMITFIHD